MQSITSPPSSISFSLPYLFFPPLSLPPFLPLPQGTLQLSVCGRAEFIFHLTRLNPDMCQIAYNTGKLSQTFFNFDINTQGTHIIATFLYPILVVLCLGILNLSSYLVFLFSLCHSKLMGRFIGSYDIYSCVDYNSHSGYECFICIHNVHNVTHTHARN